jgi:hypothetical protein
MKLSKNLTLQEFKHSNTAKRKGIDNSITPEHLENAKLWAKFIFQPIRDYFRKPIWLSSGYRSKALNKAIKGSKRSQHCFGEAGDLDNDRTSNPSNDKIFYFIKDNLDFDQLIWEYGNDLCPAWVHVSYSSTGVQRNQVLRARKNKWGRTYYEPFS